MGHFIVGPELFDGLPHGGGRRAADVLGRVTAGAYGLVTDAEHGVGGCKNFMVAMATGATRNAHLHEDLSMAALAEQLGVERMALPADIAHPRDARRRRAVVAVAVVAGRRG